LFFLPAARGQNGEIYGTVYLNGQASGKVMLELIINRKVVAKSITTSDGGYKFDAESGKTYSICFKAKGYAPRTISNIRVPVIGSVKIDQKIKRRKRTKYFFCTI
jgi:hypothetical protein